MSEDVSEEDLSAFKSPLLQEFGMGKNEPRAKEKCADVVTVSHF